MGPDRSLDGGRLDTYGTYPHTYVRYVRTHRGDRRMPARVCDRRGSAIATAWVVTIVATAASAYVLDAIAAGAGVLLASSGLLRGVDPSVLLLVLAASYVAWGAGL